MPVIMGFFLSAAYRKKHPPKERTGELALSPLSFLALGGGQNRRVAARRRRVRKTAPQVDARSTSRHSVVCSYGMPREAT